jgi:alkylation response protein AidB-like acyl-CoA dehydrogenase
VLVAINLRGRIELHFDDSPREAAFRSELRSWLDEHATPKSGNGDEPVGVFSAFLGDDEDALVERARAWQRTLADAGWAGLSWPAEYGGRSAGLVEAMIAGEELARYDVPQGVCDLGIAMIGPAIIAHGTEEQKQRWLRPMLRGDEIWCQLWSEPGAGSDLAGLATRADHDPATDEFVINGQKVWTSGAQYSQFGLGVFRSNPDVPKHKGITCLVVDMATPGIEIRPLRQLTGGAHFNEVFFTDARVPTANVVGEVDEGWTVARTVMMNERFAASSVGSPTAFLEPLIELARSTERAGRPASEDPLVRQRLADIHARSRIFDLTTARVRTSLSQGSIPGVEGSILKLVVSDLGSDAADLAVDILGLDGTIHAKERSRERWVTSYLGAHAMHIGGGTDNIQRNIIGEQVLQLPREPATDRDVPFRDLKGAGS